MNWIIHQTDDYSIEQCRDCPLPGYLIVQARSKETAWTKMSDQAIDQLGPVLINTVRAIETALEPERVYVAQFGESGGELHFHLFPRTAELTRAYLYDHPDQEEEINGPLMLDWARDFYQGIEPGEQTLEIMKKLRDLLAGG
ncbi:MAG: hypothetical protein KJ645_03830 [Planctomycetes bacterium]|nr:hypothetical protein [Planctomycetota bacterium]